MYYMYIVIRYKKKSVATTPFTLFRCSMNLTDLYEICYITMYVIHYELEHETLSVDRIINKILCLLVGLISSWPASSEVLYKFCTNHRGD